MSQLDKTQSWWQLLSIQGAAALCLPVLMIGQMLCAKYGWVAASLDVAVGNLFLLGIGLGMTFLSTRKRQTTVQQATHYFGKRGGPLLALLMIISSLGWFAIQLNVMGLSASQLLHGGSPLLLNVGLGIALCLSMCFGVRALKVISNFTAPLLALTLLYAVFSAHGIAVPSTPITLSWVGGLSLVIGVAIAAVIDLPTFFQHAKSRKHALLTIGLLYALLMPAIEAVGIYLGATTGGHTILEVLQAGHGQLWALWISCFVLFSGVTVNSSNIYSALNSSYSLPGQFTPLARTLLVGGIGTLIACFNPLGHLEHVLGFLSVAVGSMGAVMLTGYLLEMGKKAVSGTRSFFSWIAGVAVGVTAPFLPIALTASPALDAFLMAALVQVVFTMTHQLNDRGRYGKNHIG